MAEGGGLACRCRPLPALPRGQPGSKSGAGCGGCQGHRQISYDPVIISPVQWGLSG